MSRRKPTKQTKGDAPPPELNEKQTAAIDLLLCGLNVSATAAALGVGRQTLSKWCNQHALFRATLNARRQEAWAIAGDGLRALLPQVVEVLADELNGPGRMKAVQTILKAVGMDGLVPIGSTDPAEIAADDMERNSELARRSGFAALGL